MSEMPIVISVEMANLIILGLSAVGVMWALTTIGLICALVGESMRYRRTLRMLIRVLMEKNGYKFPPSPPTHHPHKRDTVRDTIPEGQSDQKGKGTT